MTNWIGVMASCIGMVVGVAGVLIALYERAQRVRVEKIVGVVFVVWLEK